jgi:hypothetical protein
MADKPVPQKLNFGLDGILEVEQSFSAQNGLLHKTADGGFYFGPGKPLRDTEIAEKLPPPYDAQAAEFIASLPPEEPVEPVEEPAP